MSSSVYNAQSVMARTDSELAAVEAIESRSLGDEVADRLREAIVTGALSPGQRLREADLSATMRVSRSPIRDALSRLGSERLLTLRPRHGAVVASIALRDIEEVYSLRVTLEGLAVRLAMERATAEDLAAMREVAARGPVGSTLHSEHQYAELDITFHDLIYRAARHERLYDSWVLLRPHILRFLVWRNMANPDFQYIYGSEHEELVETLAQGDLDRAQKMIAHHLEGAYQRLADAYRHQENPAPGDEATQRTAPSSTARAKPRA
ncbi:MAG TPA: GntR family transcriptional regulator [Candidatus Nanopelagicaceae bacterium]|nr:GntR family transcriptional regulator [Candidatus Nanopelagicaceae bacterium]